MSSRTAFMLSILLATAACRRGPSGPDAHFQNASSTFQQLYAAQLDDAYGDPKMDQVLSELKLVNPRSVDAEAASALLDNITRGREALAKQRAEREKMARSVASPSSNIDPTQVLAASAPDAGLPQDPYGTGADVSAINAESGGCLSENEPFTEQGSTAAGTVYRVVPSEGCKSKLPGFVGQAVLVVNGKIYRRIADPAPPPPPKPVAPADAGAPPAQAAAPPPSRPPPTAATAGEPEYRIVVPGAPDPAAKQPPPEQQQQ